MDEKLQELIMRHPSDAEVVKQVLHLRDDVLQSRLKDVVYFKKDLRGNILKNVDKLLHHKDNNEPYLRYAREIVKNKKSSQETLISYLSREKREADNLRAVLSFYNILFVLMLLAFLAILVVTN